MKNKTLRYKVGDCLTVIKDPAKGKVGFRRGTAVEVVSKDPMAYLCREVEKGTDGTHSAYWVHEKNLEESKK